MKMKWVKPQVIYLKATEFRNIIYAAACSYSNNGGCSALSR